LIKIIILEKQSQTFFVLLEDKAKIIFIFSGLHKNKTAQLLKTQHLTHQNPHTFSYFAVYQGKRNGHHA